MNRIESRSIRFDLIRYESYEYSISVDSMTALEKGVPIKGKSSIHTTIEPKYTIPAEWTIDHYSCDSFIWAECRNLQASWPSIWIHTFWLTTTEKGNCILARLQAYSTSRQSEHGMIRCRRFQTDKIAHQIVRTAIIGGEAWTWRAKMLLKGLAYLLKLNMQLRGLAST